MIYFKFIECIREEGKWVKEGEREGWRDGGREGEGHLFLQIGWYVVSVRQKKDCFWPPF